MLCCDTIYDFKLYIRKNRTCETIDFNFEMLALYNTCNNFKQQLLSYIKTHDVRLYCCVCYCKCVTFIDYNLNSLCNIFIDELNLLLYHKIYYIGNFKINVLSVQQYNKQYGIHLIKTLHYVNKYNKQVIKLNKYKKNKQIDICVNNYGIYGIIYKHIHDKYY